MSEAEYWTEYDYIHNHKAEALAEAMKMETETK